jgi:hypothetical protein
MTADHAEEIAALRGELERVSAEQEKQNKQRQEEGQDKESAASTETKPTVDLPVGAPARSAEAASKAAAVVLLDTARSEAMLEGRAKAELELKALQTQCIRLKNELHNMQTLQDENAARARARQERAQEQSQAAKVDKVHVNLL